MAASPRARPRAMKRAARGQALVELAVVLFLVAALMLFAFDLQPQVDPNPDASRFSGIDGETPWLRR